MLLSEYLRKQKQLKTHRSESYESGILTGSVALDDDGDGCSELRDPVGKGMVDYKACKHTYEGEAWQSVEEMARV